MQVLFAVALCFISCARVHGQGLCLLFTCNGSSPYCPLALRVAAISRRFRTPRRSDCSAVTVSSQPRHASVILWPYTSPAPCGPVACEMSCRPSTRWDLCECVLCVRSQRARAHATPPLYSSMTPNMALAVLTPSTPRSPLNCFAISAATVICLRNCFSELP